MKFVTMPDRRPLEPVDALAAFPPETDDRQLMAAPAPLRGPRARSAPVVPLLTDGRVPALIKSVHAVAKKVDVLSVTSVAATKRLTRWVIALTVLSVLLVLAVLAQTYLWLSATRSAL